MNILIIIVSEPMNMRKLFLNRDHDRCFLTPLFLMQDEVKTWGLSLFKFVTREISFWVYVTREFW